MIDLDINSDGTLDPSNPQHQKDFMTEAQRNAFWITRTDFAEEVAECDSIADGEYAMRHMLENDEEPGPLYLHGPGIHSPIRALVGKDSGDVIIEVTQGTPC